MIKSIISSEITAGGCGFLNLKFENQDLVNKPKINY